MGVCLKICFQCFSKTILFFFVGFCEQARKALKALKGLVKLQALFRGYLVRKQATETLHGMQSLIRAQATVRAQRSLGFSNNADHFYPQFRARKARNVRTQISEFFKKRMSGCYWR